MRRAVWSLLLVLGWAAWAWCEPVTLAWDPVTTNADGSPITDLSHYNVRWGTTSGQHFSGQTLGNVTQITIQGLHPSQIYFFVVVAVDSVGNESGNSNEVNARPSLVLHR